MTSTSNKTKRIAVKKYLIAKGCLALPIDSTPLSNGFNFFFVESRGPIMCVTNIVNPTKPAATKNCITIGKKSIGELFITMF